MFTTLRASAHDIPLPDGSVHLIVTSPPYYALRQYSGEQMVEFPTVRYAPMAGLPVITIQGCDPDCRHVWGEAVAAIKPGQVEQTKWKTADASGNGQTATRGNYCQLCGGWRGGLGQEPDVSAYIGHLILCLREWRRILRNDGTAWINLGDSYSGSGGSGGDYSPGGLKEGQPKTKGAKANGIPAKNLLLVPERFRLAAQADGWIVRSAFPWIKKNSLPESCLDRPSNSAESWVMLAKSSRYYWDAEAIKATNTPGTVARLKSGSVQAISKHSKWQSTNGERENTDFDYAEASGRNRRTGDWMFESLDAAIADTRRWLAHAEQVKANQGLLLDTDGDPLTMLVNPRPFAGSHFAAYPRGVVEPLILGGTSQRGCCSKCGAQWRRVVERFADEYNEREGIAQRLRNAGAQNGGTEKVTLGMTHKVQVSHVGWLPSCTCVGADIIPATVLDPFVGSGTTLEVATSLGRHSIGIDISQEYLDNVLPIRFADGVQIGMQF
jgi:DNA modification methylase